MNASAFTKNLSVLLCFVLCAALFCGCGESLEEFTAEHAGKTETGTESAETAETTEAEEDHRFDAAYAAYAPDTVLVTVGDRDILWSDYFHWVYSAIVSYESTYGTVTDWTDAADAIDSQALSSALQYAYVEQGAASMGVKITDTIKAAAQAQMNSAAAEYTTYEDFVRNIEAEYATEEYYLYTLEVSGIYTALYYTVYGEEGEYLSQEAIDKAVEEDGYRMMQMIMLSKHDEDTGELLDDDAMEKQQKLADWIVVQLDQYEDTESLYEGFGQYAEKYTDDSGYSNFKDGYLFQQGDFEDSITAAVDGLEEYEYTLVETDEAWYIVMAIPVNADSIPIQKMNALTTGTEYTLRYLVSVELYNEMVSGWTDEIPATFSETYEKLELAQLLNSCVQQ